MRSGYRDEDLAATRRMVDEAREVASERCAHIALWGGLLALIHGLIAARDMFGLPISAFIIEMSWVVIMLLAVVVSFLFERYHTVSPANILSRNLLQLWLAIGGGILVIQFLGGATGLVDAGPRTGAVAALVAIGFFVTAGLLAKRIVLVFALVWGGLAVVFFFLRPGAATFLATSAFFGFLFLPGLALYVAHSVSHRSTRTW